MQESYSSEGLEKIRDRLEGDNDYLEAESGVGGLRVTEKDTKIDFVWETNTSFGDVLRPIEQFYRRSNGIQVLDKDSSDGSLSFSKIRDYVIEGSLEDPFQEDVDRDLIEWDEYHMIQVGGDDFQITWDQRGEDKDYRVRVSSFGSGMRPFKLVYEATVEDSETEQVLSDVEEEFFDRARYFPGYWDPSKKFK